MKLHAISLLFAAALVGGCQEDGREPVATGPVDGPTRAAEPADRRLASVDDVWELAQLRGVDFRAVGADPDWILEIDEGKGLLFTLQGQPFNFPGVDVTMETAQPSWTYTTSSGGHQLMVLIEEGPCDIPGDESGTARVTATLDGRAYTGCGRGID